MITAVTTFAAPDPNANPANYTASVLGLNALVTTTIQEDITPFIKSASVPGVDDQDKLWVQLDNVGRPGGIYVFYSGLWVKMPPPPGSEIGFFVGDPTEFFDGNGAGLAGAGPIAMTYYGWHLMNGVGGVANLSDKFIIGGRMDNVGITGYSLGWRTNVTGTPLNIGGAAEATIADNNLPEINVGAWDATGDVVDAGGDLHGTGSDVTIAGQATPDPIPTVPPFFAMAYVQFLGYA